MLAGRRIPHAFLGTAVIAAALAPAAVRADGDDAALEEQIESDRTRAIVASHFADMTPAERRERARQTGHVRITGAQRLSGRIIAESFTVERGAVATIEPGTVIWSAGDIRIDGPVVPPPKPATPPVLTVAPKKAAAGGPKGADGTNAEAILFSGATYSVTAPLLLADGGDGQSINVMGTSGQGGKGGLGGGIIIQCTEQVTISENVVPGRGGRGGDARVTGNAGGPGAPGETVKSACGGKGGKSGDVRITAPKVVYTFDQVMTMEPGGRIGLRPGGRGGDAVATGGAGGDADVCYVRGGSGGGAFAIGGAAGASTKALVECKVLEQAEFDAHDLASFDPSESPDGGSATATGGNAGKALPCLSEGCPVVGRIGGAGGRGGNARATGGKGASGGQIGGGKGILRKRPQSGAEASPGAGGHATATGGRGANASDGEDGKFPGAGGAGGDGGHATSIGGDGGSSRLGKKFGQPLAGGQGPLQGGPGGNATSTSGSGGNGANGGNCCNRSGGAGGAAGAKGDAGLDLALEGNGGFGFIPGVDGTPTEIPGNDGTKGVRGEGCPGILDPFVSLTGTLPGPLFVAQNSTLSLYFRNTGEARHLKVEVCCDGRIFYTFFVDIAAGTDIAPVTTPWVGFLHIDAPHDVHHISVMVNGKLLLLFHVAVL
jgi:hypothetical protein